MIFLVILLIPGDAILIFLSTNIVIMLIFVTFCSNIFKNKLSKHSLFRELNIVTGETSILYFGLLPAVFWIYL